MPYRNQVDALAARLDSLEHELAGSRRELEQARRARSLPLLDEIRVASPCDASWEAMTGDTQVRFAVNVRKTSTTCQP